MKRMCELTGGPFDNTAWAVDDSTISLTIPLLTSMRPHPEVPMWAKYARVDDDTFEFVATRDNVADAATAARKEKA